VKICDLCSVSFAIVYHAWSLLLYQRLLLLLNAVLFFFYRPKRELQYHGDAAAIISPPANDSVPWHQ